MNNIRITAAIEFYNMNNKDKLSRSKLAGILLPEMKLNSAKQYLSSWNNGNKCGKLRPYHIAIICELTGVDANFLFGIKTMKNNI